MDESTEQRAERVELVLASRLLADEVVKWFGGLFEALVVQRRRWRRRESNSHSLCAATTRKVFVVLGQDG